MALKRESSSLKSAVGFLQSFLGLSLVLVSLGIAPVRAGTPTAQSIGLVSRSGRLVTPIPGAGARVLLESQGEAILSLDPTREKHRLIRGTLLIAPCRELGPARDIEFIVGGLEFIIKPGEVVFHLNPVGVGYLQIFSGGLQTKVRGRQVELYPGKTFSLSDGEIVEEIQQNLLVSARNQSILSLLKRDPLPVSSDGALAGAVEVSQVKGVDPGAFQIYALDPTLNDVQMLDYLASSRRIEVGGDTTPVSIPVGSEVERVLIRSPGRSSSPAELYLRIKVDLQRSVVENLLIAGGGNYVRAIVSGNLMAISSEGGSMLIEQDIDIESNPVSAPRIRLLSGHVFLQPRHITPGKLISFSDTLLRGGFVDIAGPTPFSEVDSAGVQATQVSSATLDGIFVASVPGRRRPDLIHHELLRLLPMKVENDAVAVPMISILQNLPLKVSDLFRVFPVHASGTSNVIEVSFLQPQNTSGSGPVTSWVHELEHPLYSGLNPVVEVFAKGDRSLSPDAAGDPKSSRCEVVPVGDRDPWIGATRVKQIIRKLKEKEEVRRPAAFRIVGNVTLGALVLFLAAVVLGIGNVYFSSRARETKNCPHCSKKLDVDGLFTGNPIGQSHLVNLLRSIGDVKESEDARRFVGESTSAAAPLEPDVPRENPWLEILVYWCMRCEEGVLHFRYLRDSRVIDESDTPFAGSVARDTLRRLVSEKLPGFGT